MAKPNQPKLVFRQLFDKDTGTFTYFLFDSETMEGLIIDPVKEQFDRSLQFIEELGVELKYVIDTHVHADHVTSSSMLREATGAKSFFGEPAGIECADILLEDGDELEFGNFSPQSNFDTRTYRCLYQFLYERDALYRKLFVDSRLRMHRFPVG